MRVGMGYDVHKLVEGRDLILGGVKIPYEKGLLGHSDADVLLHAIMDALLGAAALGDIGKHFPDTDPAYKGASSIRLLEEVGRMIDEKLYVIGNIDATIIAQRPKMAPHIEQMRKNVAEALHKAFHPQKVNYGAYGDTGHHLHFHLVPKYTDGYEWGGTFAMNPGEKFLSDEEYAALIDEIKKYL